MTQLNILICGAGIAGNALAVWLSKMGHNVTVIERFPCLRTTGLQIDLRGHGIEIMRRMGLEKAFPLVGDRVKYIFGTTVKAINDHDGFVEAVFEDGRSEAFDMIVGADGQGSRTRRMILEPEAADPFHPLGVYISYFTLPRPAVATDRYLVSLYLAPQRRMIFTRRHNEQKIQVYLASKPDSGSSQLDNIKKGKVEEEKDAFIELFRGAGWQTDTILKALEHSDDFYCERLGLVKMDTWSRGRVVLLGDAAYCPSATTGMGTTSSLVGAYVLAGEIGRACEGDGSSGLPSDTKDRLSSAFKNYEHKFRPFMDQVQKGLSRESSPWDYLPSTSFGVAVLNILLGIFSFFRLDLLAKWILREDVIGWTLPNYKDFSE